MAKVTFTRETWVWLVIKGEHRGSNWYDDGGIDAEFLHWMMNEKIDWRAQRTGGGAFVGRVPVEDADRIAAWLKAHGAKEKRPE